MQRFQVEQFVFSSTMPVHRPGEPGEFLTEDWPIEPTWAYPASKVKTEQFATSAVTCPPCCCVSGKAMVWGVAMPWDLLVSVGLGVCLMLTPSVLTSTGAAAHSNHVVGALIVTTAVIALADVGRALRLLNIVFGAWVIAAPWILAGATPVSTWSDAIVATLVILLSVPRGPVGERYGT